MLYISDWQIIFISQRWQNQIEIILSFKIKHLGDKLVDFFKLLIKQSLTNNLKGIHKIHK